MPRSMWNGMISFGLVNIPVGMYPAIQDNNISFNLVHREDGGRIRNQRICNKCHEPVEYSDLIKGYEYEKGRYVTLDEEDFDQVAMQSSQNIAIQDFVDAASIDPVFYDRPYYLLPDRKSERIYILLREALKKSGKVGVAKFVMRTREYLAAIRPSGDALVLDTMHFAEEIRPAEGIPEGADVADKELNMAIQLVEAMAGDWEPAKYHDTYSEALHKVVEAKLEGRELEPAEAAEEPTDIGDLMARLRASLEGVGGSATANGGAAGTASPKTTRKSAPASKRKAPEKSGKPVRKSATPAAGRKTATRKGKANLRLVA